MPRDQLPLPLQESILTTLAFDGPHGAKIAAQVQPDHFDDHYREIAQKVLGYRTKYGKPPGLAHLDDLFTKALTDPSNRPTGLHRTLLGLAAQSEGLNGEYVASLTGEFVHEQRVKQAMMAASEIWRADGADKVEEIARLWQQALAAQHADIDAGIRLNETKRSLSFLSRLEGNSLPLGITQFDRLGVGPTPKEMLLYIGPKNTGKTWFAIHCGRRGLLFQERVLHITLETGYERVLPRYYQSFFNAATNLDVVNDETLFEFDKLGRLCNWRSQHRKPDFTFDDPGAYTRLMSEIKPWGAVFGHLVVKEFPTGSLKMEQLVAYLDFLVTAEKFIPTVLIIDSPGEMYLPVQNQQLEIRKNYQELRGLAQKRNVMMVCTTQGNRSTIGARRTRQTGVAWDISQVMTADTILAYSQTEAEARMGLGRLSIESARNAPKGMQVLLSQNYSLGQYVLDSTTMDTGYWERVKDKAGGDGPDD